MAWSIAEAIAYYQRQGAPADQTALISLLREVQQESGGRIPRAALPRIAETLGVKESFLEAVIRRIPSLGLSDTHCLEICAGKAAAEAVPWGSLWKKPTDNSQSSSNCATCPASINAAKARISSGTARSIIRRTKI